MDDEALAALEAELLSGNNKDTVVADLRTAWVNERASPELLPYQHELVSQAKETLGEQAAELGRLKEDGKENLVLNLYEQDMDRVQYILRSYLRTRVWKIEKYAFFLFSSQQTVVRMSPQETAYAAKYVHLVGVHLNQSFLNFLPENLRDLDTRADDLNMIEEPFLERHVFCRIEASFPSGTAISHSEFSPDTITPIPGEVYVFPYSAVRSSVKEGHVSLL